MKTSRGKGTNSASFLIALAAENPVEIPKNVELTAEEAQLWPQFASARARVDWREFDLILLAKIVKLEAVNRKDQRKLDETSTIVETRKGTPIVNPLIAVIDSRTRLQLAIIRTLSLTAGKAPATVRGHALQARTFNQMKSDDPEDLFATPQ
jgi:hypothetical protein